MTTALHQWAVGLSPGVYLGLWWALLLVILAAVIGGIYFLTRARWIGDTPTSKIRSAHQGFIELEGTSRQLDDHRPLKSPLSGTDCVWFDIRVERYERDYDGNNRSQWRTVVRQTSDQLIRVDDGTGTCLIDPDGASCYPAYNRVWKGNTEMPTWQYGKKGFGRGLLGGKYRYTERLLLLDADLYALGWFKTIAHNLGMDIEAQVVALLRDWKQDPEQMKRFDLNQDGHVDGREWAWARRLARAQTRAQLLKTPVDETEIHTLSEPPDGRPFILSGLPQKTLIRRKRRYGFSLWALSVILFGFWIYLTDLRGVPLPS